MMHKVRLLGIVLVSGLLGATIVVEASRFPPARIGNIRSNVNDCVVTVTHVCGYVNPCVFTTDPTADITLIQLALDKSVDVTVPHVANRDIAMFVGDTNATFFQDSSCCPFGYQGQCRAHPLANFSPEPTRVLEYDGACSTTGQVFVSVYNERQAVSVRVRVDGGRTFGPV